MDLLNRVSLIGNLVADPEVKELGQDKAVATLRLAVDQPGSGKKEGEATPPEPVYVDVEVWDRNAQNAGKFLSKGKPVLVEGRLKMDSWQDKQSGQRRRKLLVRGERLRFLSLGEAKSAAA